MSKPGHARKLQAIKANRDGCNENMICPECGHYHAFYITVSAWTLVTKRGAVIQGGGDQEWGPESPCECLNCSHRGKVEDFMLTEEEVEQILATPVKLRRGKRIENFTLELETR